MMNPKGTQPEDLVWECQACHVNLVEGTVSLMYMGNRITVDLPQCPRCGFVLVSEAVALGKMAEVEQALEDK